jgi:voltage-gated potassium channel
MRLPIIVSAILPLIVPPESNGWIGIVVGVATWLVFLVDYLVHISHREHYGRTGFGRFDLFVVVATAPWFLFPGAGGGQFVVLLRLARLARLMMASKGSRRLLDQLGRVVVVAAGVVIVGSLVASTCRDHVQRRCAPGPGRRGGSSPPSGGSPGRAVGWIPGPDLGGTRTR